jgi:hypothetical protein
MATQHQFALHRYPFTIATSSESPCPAPLTPITTVTCTGIATTTSYWRWPWRGHEHRCTRARTSLSLATDRFAHQGPVNAEGGASRDMLAMAKARRGKVMFSL